MLFDQKIFELFTNAVKEEKKLGRENRKQDEEKMNGTSGKVNGT